jgi:hypothetical protein
MSRINSLSKFDFVIDGLDFTVEVEFHYREGLHNPTIDSWEILNVQPVGYDCATPTYSELQYESGGDNYWFMSAISQHYHTQIEDCLYDCLTH